MDASAKRPHATALTKQTQQVKMDVDESDTEDDSSKESDEEPQNKKMYSISLGSAETLPSIPSSSPNQVPDSAQPSDQVKAEGSPGSYSKARSILGRATKVLTRVAVGSPNLTPEASFAHEVTNKVVKAKWLEFLDLSCGGSSMMASHPPILSRVSNLLGELCKGDSCSIMPPRA
ncbi:hypothetical protein NL676_013520 [Syzygium grande]|nr:hypothetical protein NL676_013520 [Syzygium grande]